jgi:hypothetical protein
MRTATSEPIVLREATSFDDVLSRAFGKPVLDEVHGPTLRVTDWDGSGTRRVQFNMPIPPTIPRQMSRFICGRNLRFSVKQQLAAVDEAHVKLSNKVRMHFIGAEMFKVQPEFVMRKHEDGAFSVQAHVRVDAILPHPLNRVAEAFMLEHSASEFERWARAVERRSSRAHPHVAHATSARLSE